MRSIQILDEHCANQIAAGEVVERPVSVVKELVENSLDAGASAIDISVDEKGGLALIRVDDDGHGIPAHELPVALLRHATSKIRRIQDLNTLQTLGFRGEALPSIASVAKLKIISRITTAAAGMQIEVVGGKIVNSREIGCPVGTTVIVEDLFFNTPARLKFLKSPNTEFGLIADMVGRLAIARPDVSFSLKRGKRLILQTSGKGNVLEAISCVFGKTIAKRLIPLTIAEEDLSVTGYISPPDLTRSGRQHQVFIINNRVIRSPLLSRGLEQGYHTLIPSRTHPLGIIHLKISPSEFDVNVHPSKMEIRFKAEDRVFDVLARHVRETLLNYKPIKSFASAEGVAQSVPGISSQSQRQAPEWQSAVYHQLSTGHYVIKEATPETKTLPSQSAEVLHAVLNGLKPSDSPEERSPYSSKDSAYDDNTGTEDDQLSLKFNSSKTSKHDFLLNLIPLGQVFNSYILATNGDTLVIIDQHAAHERINYEQKLAEFRRSPRKSQQLIVPVTVEFSPLEEQYVLDHLWHLTDLGFILEHFGDRTYLLRGIPAGANVSEAEKLLREYLEIVRSRPLSPQYEELVEEWVYLLACKESLKAKESLTLFEMSQLIVQLSNTENPFTCPHGRPVMVHLNRSDFEKWFLRK